jgi:hypothetical protein
MLILTGRLRHHRVCFGMLLCLVALAALVGCANSAESPGATPTDETSPSTTIFAPSPVPYPSEWETTLDDAAAKAAFPLLIPNDDLANVDNLKAVFLYPEANAVVMQFPLASPPAEPINLDHIEVWEGVWTMGDAASVFQEDLDTYQIAGEKVFDIAGHPALGIEAHSSTLPKRDNAAFLRVVVDGVDLQLSGGESLDDLTRIAESMVTGGASSSPTSSP